MSNELDISILEGLSEELSEVSLESIGKSLLRQIKNYLELEPYFQNIEIKIIKGNSHKTPKPEEIFNFGVNRYVKNNIIILEIYSEFEIYYPFILLRELYNIYVPIEIVNYESVQLVINQIILTDLRKHHLVNEWRSLIRGNVEQYAVQSTGINRLVAFDRIDNFFKLVQLKFNPTRFFFHYIRKNKSLLSEKLESRDFDIHNIFFEEFEKYIQEEIVNDEIVETISCLIKLFNKTKKYHSLLGFKTLFQQFKENNQLSTDLSLRKFMNNMEWVKNSTIAPSYNINYNAMNLVPISVYIRYHPLIEKNKVFTSIENFPFIISTIYSRKNFGLDVFAIFIIPKPYLKDFINLLRKLENSGYIISFNCFRHQYVSMKINLNYYKEYMRKKILVDSNHSQYNKGYEIETVIDYGDTFYNPDLNLLDFLILDRIQWFSVTGLGFERKIDVLNSIKIDLLNDITSERAIIEDLKNELINIHSSEDLKTEILHFIDQNKKYGFFYIKHKLDEFMIASNLIDDFLINNEHINSVSQFQESLNIVYISHLIEENILLRKSFVKKTILREILPLYFKSKMLYKHQVEKFRLFNRIFSLFSNIKLFSLESINQLLKNHNAIKTVFKSKEEKLKKSYEKYKIYQVTSQKIDSIIYKLLENKPSIIIPKLEKTLPPTRMINDYLVAFINYSSENMEKLKELEIFFPRFDIRTNKISRIINVEIYVPFLSGDEKKQLYSILYNKFKEDIIFLNSFLFSGYFSAFSMKSFYDFRGREFFYTKDLFEQFFFYIKEILGNELNPINIIPLKSQKAYWSRNNEITKLVKNVNDRAIIENKKYSIDHLNKLINFNSKIQEYLQNKNKFKEITQNYFFKNYIKSIRFIPAFQNFGFSQYFLYIYPSDMNRLDLKLLLLNTFQSIKYTACIDNSNSFLITYIMPCDRPNKSYLNRIVKSEKIIREYCLFSINKIYTIIHFDFNLNPGGWNYNPEKFKIYMQNILFNNSYNDPSIRIREFNIALKSVSSYLGPNTSEYQALTKIYGTKSFDIKSFLGTRNYNVIDAIRNLLKKKLIFPYIKLKNLNLNNKVSIILPNLKTELNSKIIKIFSYFNYEFIYEIQGEYYIQGVPKEIKFENGLMILLYLPIFKHHEFIELFDTLFEYLEIKNYLILTDIVIGKELLKVIYDNNGNLNSYNPLKYLIWNEKDKIWMNHKLFTEKFKKIYPDLTG